MLKTLLWRRLGWNHAEPPGIRRLQFSLSYSGTGIIVAECLFFLETAMPIEIPEQRGVPPARPFPSQVMHLLELTNLDPNAVATIVHQSPANIEKWMTYNVREAMPVAPWLLLNLYTYCVKDVCWPEPLRAYIHDRFPGAFPDAIAPVRKPRAPDRPPAPTADAVIDMLYDAGTSLEELAFVKKGMVDSWLGPDKRPIPYAVYELTVMTLWAQQKYVPDKAMAEYIKNKYNNMFTPKG